MADEEHPVGQVLGAAEVGRHHLLLEVGDPSGDRAQDRFVRPGQRGEQGVGQLGRRSRGQPSRRQAPAQLVGVVPHLVVGDLCAVGPVHGDQDVVAHEHRQLQQVNVAGPAAQQRAVGHDEPGVGIAVERRQVASLLHRPHGLRVHPQLIPQHGGELVVAAVSVQPDEAVAALAPRLEVAETAGAQLAAARRHERHLDHGLLVGRHDGRCWHTVPPRAAAAPPRLTQTPAQNHVLTVCLGRSLTAHPSVRMWGGASAVTPGHVLDPTAVSKRRSDSQSARGTGWITFDVSEAASTTGGIRTAMDEVGDRRVRSEGLARQGR